MNETETYTFHGQRSDEAVALVTKMHIWLLLPILLIWLIVGTVLVGLILWLGASRVSSIAIVILTIGGLLYSFYFWFIWTNSNYIITNQRVLKINQIGLFNRIISEAEIQRIQEISTEIKGPVRTLLNFGTVIIKTASDDSRINLENVTNPYDIQQAIVQIQKRLLQHNNVSRLI